MGRGAGRSAGNGGLVVGLLGPVEVRSPVGQLAAVAQPMLRVLVGMLAIAPGRVVPDAALVDALWGEVWSPERGRTCTATCRRCGGCSPLPNRTVTGRGWSDPAAGTAAFA